MRHAARAPPTIPPTGKSGVVSGVAIQRVRASDDKVIETLHFWNVLELAQSLGLAMSLEKMARAMAVTTAHPHPQH